MAEEREIIIQNCRRKKQEPQILPNGVCLAEKSETPFQERRYLDNIPSVDLGDRPDYPPACFNTNCEFYDYERRESTRGRVIVPCIAVLDLTTGVKKQATYQNGKIIG